MVQKIGQITDADLYLNGEDVKGRVKEFDPGELSNTEVEHAALGMIGVLKLPGRPVEAIEGKITFDWLDEDVQRSLLLPTVTNRIQLHSYVDVFDQDGLNAEKSHTLVTHVGFQMMKTALGTSQLGEQINREHTITITSFSQKVYGDAVPIIQYDGWNGIYDVNGEPVWPR